MKSLINGGAWLLGVTSHLATPSGYAGNSKIPLELPTESSRWSVSAGAAWRNVGSLSLDPNLAANSLSTGSFEPPTAAGDLSSTANRTYDDGFVNIGAATAGTGLTTNWGYNDASQVVGGNLIYTLSGGSAFDLPGSANDDKQDAVSPYIEFAYLVKEGDDWSFSSVFTVSYTGVENEVNSSLNQYSVTLTDTYNLNGVIPPTAPYVGAFSGPGLPLINNTPDSRAFTQALVGSQAYGFEVDSDIFTFALGGEFSKKVNQSVALTVRPGIALNWVHADAESRFPTLSGGTFTANRQTSSDDKIVWGAYIQGGIDYALSEAWSMHSFVRYDWAEEFTSSVDATDYKLNLEGTSIGLGFTYRFK